jgi:hypothetical protein
MSIALIGLFVLVCRLYDLCSSTIADAQSEISEKDKLSKTNANTAKLSRSIRQKIDQIAGDVTSLSSTLAEMERRPSDYRIGEGEVNRRRGMLVQLKNNFERLKNNSQGNDAKKAGLYGDERAAAKITETDRTRDLSNGQLMQEQQLMLQTQDRHLDDILHGVTRLKVIGYAIHLFNFSYSF